VRSNRDFPRLVLDTNVFVSGLISHTGPPARILRAIRMRQAIHLVSDGIVEEYLQVLNYPRIRRYRGITDRFVADIAAYLIYGTVRIELVSTLRLSPDPDDDVFLRTAVDGRATMLITGDKVDLLSLQSVRGIPIVNASEAVSQLKV
jgi:uncharacterized protein